MFNIYGNIQRIRLEKGFSQEYMADRMNMTQNNYSKLERGLIQLTIERLYQIAEIFETDVSEIIEYNTGVKVIKTDRRISGIEDSESEKVKQLEKRISELEEQLEDKRQIIEFLKANPIMEAYESVFSNLLEKYWIEAEKKHPEPHFPEYWNSVPANQLPKHLKNLVHGYEDKLSRLVSIKLFSNKAVQNMMKEGLIKDEILIREWEWYKYNFLKNEEK